MTQMTEATNSSLLHHTYILWPDFALKLYDLMEKPDVLTL